MSETAYETINYRGVQIEIFADPDPWNPREWDNIGTLVCWHRRYKLGDLQPKIAPDEFLDDLCKQTCPEYSEAVERLENIRRYARQPLIAKAKQFVQQLRGSVLSEKLLVLPVYLYDHSGLSINTSGFSCPWDSGQVGIIYCSLENARKAWSAPDNAGWDWVAYPAGGLPNWLSDGSLVGLTLREIVKQSLRDEVKTYDQYLRNEVYGWTTGENSCWGYFGSDFEKSGLMEAARQSVDAEIREHLRVHCHRLKKQIINHVPLGARTALAV